MLQPDRELPSPDHYNSCNVYLSCMIAFARFAGDVWDQAFAARSIGSSSGETIAVLDGRIKYWIDAVCSSIPLLPKNRPATKRHLWQQSLVRTVSTLCTPIRIHQLTLFPAHPSPQATPPPTEYGVFNLQYL